ncbi:MAG: family 10 glycosylhydrolase [Clostridia bacterium]|nr:family 10 glycosylhydrolase [Clostridia bacterium]
MEMPELLAPKLTSLLLGAMILLSPVIGLFTGCADVSAAAEPRTAAQPAIARVDPIAYTAPEQGGEGILNPDAEVRGVWIASVLNINYPSEPGLSAAKLAAEIDDILANCEKNGFNAVYFQVRPTADALYKSELFPTSYYLTGEQGKALAGGFDPLAYLLAEAHARNIRVHAWVNPLRVTSGTTAKPQTDIKDLAAGHPARVNAGWAIPYADGKLYFDAGIPEVRQFVIDGVAEIVRNYDVDGIIFDDYFYPYPVKTDGKIAAFADDATFASFNRGITNKDDWRRDNINQLIEGTYLAIKRIDPECEFGVAPFGIWQNADGENGGSDTSGLNSYSEIYCDALAWIKGGYVDYIAPQIYWRFTTNAARYDVLTRWWNAQVDGTGVDLLISHGVYNYETWENPEGELAEQIEYARSELNYRGSIHYGYAAIEANLHGLADELRAMYEDEIIYTDPTSTGAALKVASPANDAWIDASSTYLIGASDPAKTLLFEGEPVSRTKSGYFSVYTPLKEGKNTFTFTYGGETITHVINAGTRPSSGTGTPAAKDLGKFTLTVSAPAYDIAAAPGTAVTLSCVAPSGSTVTASINGKTVTLKAASTPTGSGKYLAATYSGSYTLPSAPDGTVVDLGTVTYHASRKGESASAAGASVRVMGKDAVIPVEVIRDSSEMKLGYDTWYYDDFTPQVTGMRDYAVSQGNGYYKLRVAGYIEEKNLRELPAGTTIEIAQINRITVENEGEHTVITINAAEQIPMNGYVENGRFYLSLYNIDTAWTGKVELADNPLFTAASWEKSTKANSIKLALTLRDVNNFYGFEFDYDAAGRTLVRLRNPQGLSDGAAPLAGKVIVLDAGHGGADSGALGPSGEVNEADLNLAITLRAAEALRRLGAEVILTREADVTVEMNDRLTRLDEIAPDLSISIHQNSMGYATDITKVRGLVALYYADAGKLLTECISSSVAGALNRYERTPSEQRLALCRNARFPSTLVEVGFITCVEEYEKMQNADVIAEAGDAVAQGVLDYYRAQEKWIK